MNIEQIKKLREMTGAGVNAVREAIRETNGSEEEALKYLRQKGIAKADKRKDKSASEGLYGTYIHGNRKVVVVVEVNCETDFAAKSEDMIKFANDVALHIAAVSPKFISPDNIDEKTLEAERDTYMKDLEGKPEEVKEKILEGKMQKFYEQSVLLHQKLFSDDSKTVQDYLNDMVTKIGEKIEISNFTKYEIAQAPSSCNVTFN